MQTWHFPARQRNHNDPGYPVLPHECPREDSNLQAPRSGRGGFASLPTRAVVDLRIIRPGGFEPPTSRLSTGRSAAELRSDVINSSLFNDQPFIKPLRWESNPHLPLFRRALYQPEPHSESQSSPFGRAYRAGPISGPSNRGGAIAPSRVTALLSKHIASEIQSARAVNLGEGIRTPVLPVMSRTLCH